MKNLIDLVRLGESQFKKADLYFGHGTTCAWDEAAYLALFALKLSPTTPLETVTELTVEQQQNITALFDKRINAGKPAAYLTHEAWFCGLPFYVDERVMIPRSPLAELIANEFSPWLSHSPLRILDLCTGSGCIAIACAHVFPETKITATDLSKDALAVANINIKKHNLENQLTLIQSDLFSAVPLQAYDIIISNPPYVGHAEYQDLPKEYHFEPTLAFEGGDEDGLKLVNQMIQHAKQYLAPHGILVVEVGNSQAALIKRYPHLPFVWLEFEHGEAEIFLLTAAQL